MTMLLIKDELRPSRSALQDGKNADTASQKPKKRKHSVSNHLDPYSSLSKQKTTASARFNHGGARQSQNSSLVHSHLNQLSKDRSGHQPFTQSNLHQLGTRDHLGSSTVLNNSGIASVSYFANPEQIRNERESLERIHTFSLKEPTDFDASDDLIGAKTQNFLDPLLPGGQSGSATERLPNDPASRQNVSMDAPFSSTRERGISQGSRNSSTTSNRSCSHYVPDKVKIFQKQIKQVHDIMGELISIQQEFRKISEWSYAERRDFFTDRMAEKKRLKISFQTFEEMNKLQIEQKFKITARSALGMKNFGTDDWIFSFNIGNIMHL